MDKYDEIRQKKEAVTYDIYYNSSTIQKKAKLGTIESDAQGLYGKFVKESFRGERILNKLVTEYEFKTVLDVGAGKLEATSKFLNSNKIVDICDYKDGYYINNSIISFEQINNTFFGDFNIIDIPTKYDVVWCSHILEHQLNPNIFLKKLFAVTKEGGYLAIVVPPRKPFIVGGHVSLWNGGLLLYHLILAGFDCSNAKLLQYDYNIGVIVQKKTIHNFPEIQYDLGDISLLKQFFPIDIDEGFNGDIMNINFD